MAAEIVTRCVLRIYLELNLHKQEAHSPWFSLQKLFAIASFQLQPTAAEKTYCKHIGSLVLAGPTLQTATMKVQIDLQLRAVCLL